MDCKKIQEQFTRHLESSLSEGASSDVEKHLKSCSDCQKELDEMKAFLLVLESQEMEKPSSNLRMNFARNLAVEIEEKELKTIPLNPKQNWKLYLRVAATVLLIVSAFLLGKQQANITRIAKNIQKGDKKEVLDLLKNNSASKRILAVYSAEKFTKKDTKIIQALINRLFFDKNTNVRLAAAETLLKFSSERMVRDALIKSLETDKSTAVQIELIQILSKIQEKRALKPMEEMLKKEETPQYVKQQLQLNLPSLL
jgi:hypothetical protein